MLSDADLHTISILFADQQRRINGRLSDKTMGKNNVDRGSRPTFEFGFTLLRAHAREQTIEHVTCQGIMKDNGYLCDRNRAFSQLSRVSLEH